MGPFITIRRQEVVDLASPWDPSRVIEEYLADTDAGHRLPLSETQLPTLRNDGLVVSIDARHRWTGAMSGAMRLAVLNPTTVEVDIDGSATVRWWLYPFALPFRRRIRRAVDARIDKLIAELETDIQEPVTEAAEPDSEPSVDGAAPAAEHPPASNEGGASGLRGLSWRLRLLTLGGALVYQQDDGDTRAL